MKGAMSAQKALEDSKTEPREVLEGRKDPPCQRNDWFALSWQIDDYFTNIKILNKPVLVAIPGDWDPNESHPQAMSRDDIEVLSCHPDHSAYVQ